MKRFVRLALAGLLALTASGIARADELLWMLIISSPRLYVVIRDTALTELAKAKLMRSAEKLAGMFRWTARRMPRLMNEERIRCSIP
jgi:hypothetical protein